MINWLHHLDDRRWLWGVIILAVGLANVPAILAFLFPPPGMNYAGIDSTAPGDVNVYLSYMEQVRHGEFIFRDLYTSEPQSGTIFNPFWLVLGLVGVIFHLPPLFMYFLVRIMLGILLLWVLYQAAEKIFHRRVEVRIAWLLAVFASGVGAWFAPYLEVVYNGDVPTKAWPMDLWVSEAFTFLQLHHSPHFLAATILIILSVWNMSQIVLRGSWRSAVWAGLAMLGLYAFHPFHVLSLGLIAVSFFLVGIWIRRADLGLRLLQFATAWVIASPAVFYHLWLIRNDPLAAGRAEQNILPTTWPSITVVSYGLLFFAAIAGAIILYRRRRAEYVLLIAWAIAHSIAIYLPVFFNRRLTHGLNIALALLAAPAVAALWESRWRQQFTRSAFGWAGIGLAGIGLLLASNLWVVSQDASHLFNKGRSLPYYFYLPTGYDQAFQWLRKNGDTSTVVLTAPVSGNFVPGKTGRRVFVGHNVETIDFETKREQAVMFYGGANDAWREEFLRQAGITHVLIGPWEKRWGAYDGQGSAFLELILERDQIRLYRVRST